MQKPFDISDHQHLKMMYVPGRGDRDPVFLYVLDAISGHQRDWRLDEWEALIQHMVSSDLTVGEYLEEFTRSAA